MTDLPTPSELLQRSDELWERLRSSLVDVTDDELLRPGAAGDWTGKDVLLHLARWHEHAAAGIRAHLDGREPFSLEDGFQAQNERWHEEDRDVPAAEARLRCQQSRDALHGLLRELEPGRWDEMVRGWMDATTAGHYEEHLAFLAEGDAG